jgi:tRNA pseudouridine38-40 synthase
MKVLLRISFLGTNYCGYQVQPNGVTVQQKLNEATKKLFGYDCDIVGCSRTDSGVHANEFCVTVTKKKENSLYTAIPVAKIPGALAFYLPEDISVLSAQEVDESFHPRYDVKYKEYVYKIWNRPYRDPFLFGRSWHCPRVIDTDGLENMKRAAKKLVGTKDFVSYMATDSKVTDTVRTVYDAEISEQDGLITFRVRADGFLYNMVRIFVGTLLDVGYGRIAPEDIDKITEAKDRRAAGSTARPEGLFLNKVVY